MRGCAPPARLTLLRRSRELSAISLLLALQLPVANVEVPRSDAAVIIDGVLDEAVWRSAAVIDDFWQYEPADGRRAEERTEVRVWYGPDAIYFGIHAFDTEPQSIRAKRANRDNLGGDDRITIYLDTFRDRRRAFFFTVNAFGSQEDGVRTEGSGTAGRTFGGNSDTSPDFLFESQGRLTNDGYVIEMRIPFKSLRYPAADEMSWGINIERRSQRTGFTDTWPQARRASASFLAQGGALTGLRDLRRGIVFEAQPTLTANAPGVRTDGVFERADPDLSAGVSVRLGFSHFSVDATINPDFSQVEADAGQVTANERFALFVTEKRPFFLEGIDLFATPNQLVYTRQIVDPLVGGKFTGKLGSLNTAHLTAIDQDIDAAGRDALFNITRLRHDLGSQSQAGITVTDRSVVDSAAFNRVIAADTRIVFGRMYFVEAQAGGSWTRHDSVTHASPIWKLEVDRTGRAFGFNYALNGVGENFESHAGFVNRRNIVTARAANRLTWYGATGALLERVTTFFSVNRLAEHDGGGFIEGSESVNTTFRLRAGWELSARVGRDYVELDPQSFADYEAVAATGTRVYSPLDGVSGPSLEISATSPSFRKFDANAAAGAGRVTIFAEGSAGDARSARAALALRPAASVRITMSTTYQRIMRARDGSEFARTVLPRLRAEFQPRRSFFLRAIAEYRAERRDALRDARSGDPLNVRGAPTSPVSVNGLRIDLLASYQPVPGTVAFIGYGASIDDTRAFAFDGLTRANDGIFIKLAYQIRR
jgi:hypothetical protein